MRSHLSTPCCPHLLQHLLLMKGLRMGPNQGDTACEYRTCLGAHSADFPSGAVASGSSTFVCQMFPNLVPTTVSFAPWPVEGLLHSTVLPFCILPSLPSILALVVLCRQYTGHSPSSSQLMLWGFNKKRFFPCNLTGQWGQIWDKAWSTSTEKWLLSTSPAGTALGQSGKGCLEGGSISVLVQWQLRHASPHSGERVVIRKCPALVSLEIVV